MVLNIEDEEVFWCKVNKTDEQIYWRVERVVSADASLLVNQLEDARLHPAVIFYILLIQLLKLELSKLLSP
ncbi:MAG: hypothetical protein ACKFI0_00020 [Candidatus Hodgkinia cicadicola]